MEPRRIQGQLDTLILATLKRQEAHGYAVASILRERSGQELDLPGGTIYPALRRLERAGLVAGRWVQVNQRRRRLYTITEAGLAALDHGRREWLTLQHVMGAVLGT